MPVNYSVPAIDYSYPQGVSSIHQDGNIYIPAGFGLVYQDPTVRQSWTIAMAIVGGVDTGGGLGAWLNPTGANIIVDQLLIWVPTAGLATAACTIEAGGTTVSATTVSATLISGANVHSAQILTSNYSATTGVAPAIELPSGGWITFSTASGASAGLAATAYISFFLV